MGFQPLPAPGGWGTFVSSSERPQPGGQRRRLRRGQPGREALRCAQAGAQGLCPFPSPAGAGAVPFVSDLALRQPLLLCSRGRTHAGCSTPVRARQRCLWKPAGAGSSCRIVSAYKTQLASSAAQASPLTHITSEEQQHVQPALAARCRQPAGAEL